MNNYSIKHFLNAVYAGFSLILTKSLWSGTVIIRDLGRERVSNLYRVTQQEILARGIRHKKTIPRSPPYSQGTKMPLLSWPSHSNPSIIFTHSSRRANSFLHSTLTRFLHLTLDTWITTVKDSPCHHWAHIPVQRRQQPREKKSLVP